MNEDEILLQAVDIATHLMEVKEVAEKYDVMPYSMAIRIHLPSQRIAQEVLELVRQISDLEVKLVNYYVDSDLYDFEYRP